MVLSAKSGSVQTNMAHVTDWLPTLLEFGGCRGLDYGGKPLDGISLASAIFDQSESESYHPREEILHFMNPLGISDRTDPRESEWKNGPLKGKCFTPTTRAALRWKQWKLLTGSSTSFHPHFTSILGDHDKNDGWFKPDTSRYFKKKNGRYPAKAYEPLNEEFCGDECDDVILPRRLPFCFKPSFHSLQSGAKGVLDVFMEEKFNPTVNMSLHPADRLVQGMIIIRIIHAFNDLLTSFDRGGHISGSTLN